MRISIAFLLVALVGGLVAVACDGTATAELVARTQAPAATAQPAPLATSSPVPAATATTEPTIEPTGEPTRQPIPTATIAPTLEPTATPVPATAATPADAEAELTLELLRPDELEVITEESRIELVGSTRVDAVVTINDTVVEPDGDGVFSLGVDLEEGPNLIEIVVSVASGEQKDLVLVVVYIP